MIVYEFIKLKKLSILSYKEFDYALVNLVNLIVKSKY